MGDGPTSPAKPQAPAGGAARTARARAAAPAKALHPAKVVHPGSARPVAGLTDSTGRAAAKPGVAAVAPPGPPNGQPGPAVAGDHAPQRAAAPGLPEPYAGGRAGGRGAGARVVPPVPPGRQPVPGGAPLPAGGQKRTEHHDSWLEKLAGWTKVNLGDLLTHPAQVATGAVKQGSGPAGLGAVAGGAGHAAPGWDIRHQAGQFGRGFEYGVVDAGEKVTKTLGGALHLKVSGAMRAEDGLKRSLATGPGADPNSRAFHWGQGAGTAVAVGGATVAVAGAVAAAAAATPVAGLVAGGAAAAAGAVGLSSGAAAVAGGAAVVMGSEAIGAAAVTAAMGGGRGDVAKAALFAGVAGAGGAAFKVAATPLLGAVAGAAPRLAGVARVTASGVGGAASMGAAAGVTELAGGGKPGEAWHEALKAAALGGVMGAGAEGVGGIVSRMGAKARGAKPAGPVAAGAGDGSLPGRIAREPGRPDHSNNIWREYSATPEQVADYVQQPNGKVKVVIHLDGNDVPAGATPAELVKKNQGQGLHTYGRMSVVGPDGAQVGASKPVLLARVNSSRLVKGGSGRVVLQDALNAAGLQHFDADGPDVELFREFPDQLTGGRRMVEAKQGFEPKLSETTIEALKKLRPEELRDLDVKFVPQPDTAPHAIVAPDPGARLTGQGLRALATAGTVMEPLQRAAASIVPSLPGNLKIGLPLKAMAKQFSGSTGTPLVVPEDLMDRMFGSSVHGVTLQTNLQRHVTDAVRADLSGDAPSGTVSGVTPPKVFSTSTDAELSRTVGDAPVEQPWTATYERQRDGSVRVRARYTTELHDRYDWGALTEKAQNLDEVPGVTGLFMTPGFREVFFRRRPQVKDAIKESVVTAFGKDAGLYSDALFSTLSARGVAKPFDTIGTTSPRTHEFVIPAAGAEEPPADK